MQDLQTAADYLPARWSLKIRILDYNIGAALAFKRSCGDCSASPLFNGADDVTIGKLHIETNCCKNWKKICCFSWLWTKQFRKECSRLERYSPFIGSEGGGEGTVFEGEIISNFIYIYIYHQPSTYSLKNGMDGNILFAQLMEVGVV